jgi:hypothetical protein
MWEGIEVTETPEYRASRWSWASVDGMVHYYATNICEEDEISVHKITVLGGTAPKYIAEEKQCWQHLHPHRTHVFDAVRVLISTQSSCRCGAGAGAGASCSHPCTWCIPDIDFS